MNQILTTKPVKARKKTVKIKTVKIFFAISIIIFGLCLISTGSYAVYKEISSKKTIQNNNQENNGPVYNENAAEINIQLQKSDEVGTEAKLIVNSEEVISFVTYRWDDEEEKRIDIDGLTGECTVTIPSGNHTITIVAVDKNNNTQTKKVKVEGVTHPTLQVTKEDNQMMVVATDELGIEKIEIYVNGTGYLVPGVNKEDGQENEKKTELKIKANILVDGENKIEVKAYNVKNVTETFTDTWQK